MHKKKKKDYNKTTILLRAKRLDVNVLFFLHYLKVKEKKNRREKLLVRCIFVFYTRDECQVDIFENYSLPWQLYYFDLIFNFV